MSVLRPRNRLVNFRLSEDEFELLRDSCEMFGARSISDFARTSVLDRLARKPEENTATPAASPVGQLGNKVAELEMRVGQILNLLQATQEGSAEPVETAVTVGVATSGHMRDIY
ncbi:MAG: hypothetical protein R2729_08130 [Bryobacteraceae bacterium]